MLLISFILSFFLSLFSISTHSMEIKEESILGTSLFYFEEEGNFLIPYFWDKSQKGPQALKSFNCAELQPTIINNPLILKRLLGNKTCKKIGFIFTENKKSLWSFKQMPSPQHYNTIFSQTKSFHDRFRLVSSLGDSHDFLKAHSEGAVLLVKGASTFKGNTSTLKNPLIRSLNLQYAVHDMFSHSIQALWPPHLHTWLKNLTKLLFDFQEEANNLETLKKHNLLFMKDLFINMANYFVSIIDANHADCGLSVGELLEKNFHNKEELTVFANEMAVLFLGQLVNFDHVKKEFENTYPEIVDLWRKYYSTSIKTETPFSINFSELNQQKVFYNYIVSALIFTHQESPLYLSAQDMENILNMASDIADKGSESTLSLDVSYKLIDLFRNQQKLLEEEIISIGK